MIIQMARMNESCASLAPAPRERGSRCFFFLSSGCVTAVRGSAPAEALPLSGSDWREAQPFSSVENSLPASGLTQALTHWEAAHAASCLPARPPVDCARTLPEKVHAHFFLLRTPSERLLWKQLNCIKYFSGFFLKYVFFYQLQSVFMTGGGSVLFISNRKLWRHFSWTEFQSVFT